MNSIDTAKAIAFTGHRQERITTDRDTLFAELYRTGFISIYARVYPQMYACIYIHIGTCGHPPMLIDTDLCAIPQTSIPAHIPTSICVDIQMCICAVVQIYGHISIHSFIHS